MFAFLSATCTLVFSAAASMLLGITGVDIMATPGTCFAWMLLPASAAAGVVAWRRLRVRLPWRRCVSTDTTEGFSEAQQSSAEPAETEHVSASVDDVGATAGSNDGAAADTATVLVSAMSPHSGRRLGLRNRTRILEEPPEEIGPSDQGQEADVASDTAASASVSDRLQEAPGGSILRSAVRLPALPPRTLAPRQGHLHQPLRPDCVRAHTMPALAQTSELSRRISTSISTSIKTMMAADFGRAAQEDSVSAGNLLMSISQPVMSEAMSAEDEELMRKLYLEMIEGRPEAILEELALPLREEFRLEDEGVSTPSEPPLLSITSGDEVITFENKEAISIGRVQVCDIITPESDQSVSRMHCWIFNLPAAILVVDGWSFVGTRLVDREQTEKEMPASLPHDRRVLMIPHGEAATLQLGSSIEVTLNPKLCMICCERPRSVRLACGHQAFCAVCIRKGASSQLAMTTCPLCRKPFDPGQLLRTGRAACQMTCIGPLVDDNAEISSQPLRSAPDDNAEMSSQSLRSAAGERP
eukprot:TRINITY_DN31288_c0_g1_i1.p1 TRINITY_DN31288_c0_g1~~TRINITY_DN31288_c0_g1_i1.p1  ORF type:complete len:528 (+),score=94.80 TRINITY_DN31288_c0_g1_i1:32-1615(+)